MLLALEKLPNGSLWTTRFPRRDALHVAARGAAFVRDPDAASLAALAQGLWPRFPGLPGPTAVRLDRVSGVASAD